MREQRRIGLAIIAISAAIVLLAFIGTTPEDRNATIVLLTLPLGIYTMVTKKYILYDSEPEQIETPPGEQSLGATRKEPHYGKKTHC